MRGLCVEISRFDVLPLLAKSYNEIASQLFVSPRTVLKRVRTFLNTGDVKTCRLGRPTASISLFPYEEYVVVDCVLRKPQIQLYEIANFIFNATGLSLCLEMLCPVVYRPGITRNKMSSMPIIFVSF